MARDVPSNTQCKKRQEKLNTYGTRPQLAVHCDTSSIFPEKSVIPITDVEKMCLLCVQYGLKS